MQVIYVEGHALPPNREDEAGGEASDKINYFRILM